MHSNKLVRIALACLLAASAITAVCAETWRVDNVLGDDANDGIHRPFRTIARALESLGHSDTLSLTANPEPYRESLPIKKGGTPQAPTIIEGNGATLSGADIAPKDGWTEADGIYRLEQKTEVKFLFGPGICYRKAANAKVEAPEQWFWEAGTLYFRPAEGRTPADYELRMSVRISGLMTTGACQVIIRNLRCENFWNDGFNIHGGSAPLWFENIAAEWNGDEGFSAHENCECYVRGAVLSHNQCHGIADGLLARTHFSGLTVRDNVLKGILFLGGFHSVIDSEVSGSPENIALAAPSTSLLNAPLLAANPLRESVTNLRNVVVRSGPGQTGIAIAGSATGVVEHCLIEGGRFGVRVAPGGHVYLTNSVVAGASEAEVWSEGNFGGDYNLLHPGRLFVAGKRYGPEQFDAYRADTGNDAHSILGAPKFIPGTPWASRASVAAGRAYDTGGYGGADIGPVAPGPKPAESADILPLGAERTAAGGVLYRYDFEMDNPWSRVYPDPDRTSEGAVIQGSAELSDAQAHSGKRSVNLRVQLPAAPPARWLIKLFSTRLHFEKPVTRMSFWVYGDGSGLAFRPRVRDASGEAFYGPVQTLDWEGWRQVNWDLATTPPSPISMGDGNKLQDGPPMEIVVEFTPKLGPGPTELSVYVDDLEVELAP
ncbi:MAG: right-handed parallel beta-helix repeat-containing protein [Armatimonadetes bacterium]|nr:right-handed parallel beta-helix repeat-containing protein [Armatimonadota bacterium]